MKLIGSITSPYVRRIRLFMDHQPHEFVNLNIYSEEGREALKSYTPVMKIPVLVHEDQTLFDSRVIQRYLANEFNLPELTWDQENLLTMVDAVNDSFVILFMSKRSGFDIESDALIAQLQKERIANTMQLLEQAVLDGHFDEWDYPAICLYCLVDWVLFRDLYDFSAFPALVDFHQSRSVKALIKSTDPRLSEA